MVWHWDHTKVRTSRGYSAHAELGEELRAIAPRQDWEALRVLFNRPSGDQFDIQPEHAARMATALKSLVPLVDPEWSLACRDLAASAAEAGRTNSLWHWS